MKKHLYWVSGLVTLTLVFGTIYVVSQQVLRQDANEPQVQLAEDGVAKVNNNESPAELSSGFVDIAASLKPFVIVYDKSGKYVTGGATLDGNHDLIIPFGVLQHASPNHNNIVTWQPRSGVRIATVTAAANNYYVVAGRNLREVEKRENQVFQLPALGWLASVMVWGGTYWYRSQSRQSKK